MRLKDNEAGRKEERSAEAHELYRRLFCLLSLLSDDTTVADVLEALLGLLRLRQR